MPKLPLFVAMAAASPYTLFSFSMNRRSPYTPIPEVLLVAKAAWLPVNENASLLLLLYALNPT